MTETRKSIERRFHPLRQGRESDRSVLQLGLEGPMLGPRLQSAALDRLQLHIGHAAHRRGRREQGSKGLCREVAQVNVIRPWQLGAIAT
jgi:hypothetical protein